MGRGALLAGVAVPPRCLVASPSDRAPSLRNTSIAAGLDSALYYYFCLGVWMASSAQVEVVKSKESNELEFTINLAGTYSTPINVNHLPRYQ
jgi:hypothetical protein